MTFRNVDELKK